MKTAELFDLVGRLGKRSEPLVTPDADLLNRFLADRDGQAFAILVRRHGPLDYGVCRRVTGDHHLAEDAFQAVFVVLAAKATSVRPRAALPSWLYGVAHRVALRARTMRDRRRRRETPVGTVPERASPVVDGAEVGDLAAVLDEEIARLPEYQRVPVVVCDPNGNNAKTIASEKGRIPFTFTLGRVDWR
jgi:RNA polymerase sigma-70 factor (ECF subfamily)